MKQEELLNLTPESEIISGRQVQAQYVQANISQESEMKLNVRIVSSKDLPELHFFEGCRPRKSNAPSPNYFQFPAAIAKNFKEVNKKILEWLSASNDNVHAYLDNPVNALIKAGVELPREDQKYLSRNFENVKAGFLAAPGTNVKTITATVNPNNLITKQPGKSGSANNKDCGC
jgi:hypothetical protein